ncbi:hypothetical protein OHA28_19315 [Streptomyces sp. NBC_00269]|uniref:DUF6731 family protein n=1 Tax=Streptomyces sp. NBC_00269 TaxID=2975696 RepID=UPI002E2B3BCB|nr:DUF6731 family protein [Streptomyces sp. NBC_00269]
MLQRRLIFHRWGSVAGKPDFDPRAVSSALISASSADSDFAIFDDGDSVTAVQVASVGVGSEPTNLRLFALRGADNRPFKWDTTGSVSPISLSAHEYPADVSHVSLWPDGVCAQDYAKDVPRLSRLSLYLRRKMSSHVKFDALYHEDMVEKLKAMEGQMRSVEVAMARRHPETNGQVFGTLVPENFGRKAPSIRFTLGMGRYGPRDRYLDGETEEQVFALAEQADDFVTNMIIRGRNSATGRVETINLLQERLQVEQRFSRSSTVPSMPNPDDVFQALDQAYKDFEQNGKIASAVQGQKMRGKA